MTLLIVSMFLVSVSAILTCFKQNGYSPQVWFLKFFPRVLLVLGLFLTVPDAKLLEIGADTTYLTGMYLTHVFLVIFFLSEIVLQTLNIRYGRR